MPFLLSVFLPVRAQQLLSFLIADGSTGKGVPFAFVIVQGTTQSITTDEEGRGVLFLQPGDTLIVYQTGYHSKRVAAESLPEAFFTISLSQKAALLEEVTVAVRKSGQFLPESNTTYLDLAFYDDLLLALSNKGQRQNQLSLHDLSGKRIAALNTRASAETLFKDCFGNLHLVGRDSAWQIYYDYRKLQFLSSCSRQVFDFLLQPCVSAAGERAVYKFYRHKALQANYVLFEKNKRPRILDSTIHAEALDAFRTDYSLNFFLDKRRRGEGYGTSVTELKKHLDELREQLRLPPNYQNLLVPVQSQMLRFENGFCLIDHTNSVIRLFDASGTLTATKKISGKHAPDMTAFNEVLSNTAVLYSLDRHGELSLFRLDLQSGRKTHVFHLEKFRFPRQFVLHDDQLFLLSKDGNGRKKIFRVPVVWSKI